MRVEALFIVTALPLIMALGSLLPMSTGVMRKLEAVGMWLHLLLVASLILPMEQSGVPITISPELMIDRLGGMFMLLTIMVAACSLTHAHFYFSYDERNGQIKPWTLRLLYACANFFVLAMTIVFCSNNLGFLWIAVEATTLSSAPLVYFSRSRHALEATWKYLIICSVGIAFALLGTVLMFASSQHGHSSGGTLNITELINQAALLHLPLLRLGFIFCLLGYGTKAGMFPIHSWLPDAHAEAPAPASAMLSGSLLNCALFGIWRCSQVVVASGHLPSTQNLVIWVGTITVAAASIFLVWQHGFKRLWAYSSIENVGLMLVAIGLASGPLFFLQALNHSIAKVALFLVSGNIIQSSGTKELSELKGVLKISPAWGMLLALAACAVTGAPPFGAFISEWLILTRTVDLNHWLAATCLVLALTLAFIAVSIHLGRILLGNPRAGVSSFRPLATSAIPALLICCSLALGFMVSPANLGSLQ